MAPRLTTYSLSGHLDLMMNNHTPRGQHRYSKLARLSGLIIVLSSMLAMWVLVTATSPGEQPPAATQASAVMLPDGYASLSNTAAIEKAWLGMSEKPCRLAPVSGGYPSAAGYRPFIHIPYETLMDDDVLPLSLMTVDDYRAKLETQLKTGGERELLYLERMVYGDTAKWMSGTNDADFRFVDGLPLLPPEWSIAHELLLEAQLSKTLQS